MNKQWVMATVTGLLISVLLLFHYFGISAVVTTGFVLYMVWSYKKDSGIEPSKTFYGMAAYAVLLSGIFVITTTPVVRFFAGLFLFVILLALGLSERSWLWVDWVSKLFAFVGGYLSYYGEYFKFSHKLNRKKSKLGMHIVVGLVLALPILLVAIALLSSADVIFSQGLDDLSKSFREFVDAIAIDGMENWLFRVIIFFAIAPTCYGAWFYFVDLNQKNLEPSQEMVETIPNTPSNKESSRFMPSATTGTILTLLNIVYLIFAYVQFRFLFFGGPDTMNYYDYASYAREGFFELVTLSLLNTAGILFMNRFSKPHRFNQIGLTITVVCTFVMMTSSYYKMNLYETAYGYTQLRLYVYLILAYMFVFMALIMVHIWRPSFKVIEVCMVIGLLYFMVVGYVNTDKLIAKKNIERYEATQEMDLWYLTTLSEDAAEVIIPFIETHEELLDQYSRLAYSAYKSDILDNHEKRAFYELNMRHNKAYTMVHKHQ